MITAILLAAGLSARFGSPKALARINNKYAVNFLLENQSKPRLAVFFHATSCLKCNLIWKKSHSTHFKAARGEGTEVHWFSNSNAIDY